MNTENDIKEFGFRHISINTVYNRMQLAAVRRYRCLLATFFIVPFSVLQYQQIHL